MDFDTLLGQIQTSRPDLADSLALIKQFQNSKSEKISSNRDNDDEVVVVEEYQQSYRSHELENLLEKQRDINRNLLEKYEQLKTNYQQLIPQMDELAEAIGACPHCWGEEKGCNYCRGKGKPGYFHPNQTYFDFYVKPVILKLKNKNL